MDWFLYDNGLRHERVKHMQNINLYCIIIVRYPVASDSFVSLQIWYNNWVLIPWNILRHAQMNYGKSTHCMIAPFKFLKGFFPWNCWIDCSRTFSTSQEGERHGQPENVRTFYFSCYGVNQGLNDDCSSSRKCWKVNYGVFSS